jgi:hypothetical protein
MREREYATLTEGARFFMDIQPGPVTAEEPGQPLWNLVSMFRDRE